MNLLKPERLWRREEVLARPCPVPNDFGVYAWYFNGLEGIVPLEGCVFAAGLPLLYVGIAPGRPPQNGKPPSRQRLRQRVRYHYRGNAEGSTLRLTLGCLLSEQLGLQLRRVGSGTRLTFDEGEQRLSEWMHENAFVTWHPTEKPWELEHELIERLSLPLNLDMNRSHPFHARLTELRKSSKAAARALP